MPTTEPFLVGAKARSIGQLRAFNPGKHTVFRASE